MTKQLTEAELSGELGPIETKCERCDGTGWVWRTLRVDDAIRGVSVEDEVEVECPRCDGSGVQVEGGA